MRNARATNAMGGSEKSDREHVLIIHIYTDPLQGLIADTGYY